MTIGGAATLSANLHELSHSDLRSRQKRMRKYPQDRNGKTVRVGARVRLVFLSGQWFEDLPEDEKADVQSMIGEVFRIEEIDEYGHPWIRKSWPNDKEGTCHSHSIALEAQEMELVEEPAA